MNTKEQEIKYNKENLLENIRTIEDFEKAMKNEEFRKAYLNQFKDEETKKVEFVR